MVAVGLSPDLRRKTLQVLLALSAGATAATLGASLGWGAILCILLTGNTLWALEMDLREAVDESG